MATISIFERTVRRAAYRPHLRLPTGRGTRLAITGAIAAAALFSILIWSLLSGDSAAPAADQSGARSASATSVDIEQTLISPEAISKALRRSEKGIEYGGVSDIEMTVTFATPEYFETSMPAGAAQRYLIDQRLVFLVAESTHVTDLPEGAPPLVLHIRGDDHEPIFSERRVSSPHHRVSIVSFDVAPEAARSIGVMTIEVPGNESVAWVTPISYDIGRTSPFGLTWGTILALLGGLLASMWPCLFQLTVFFIPTLAGMNMEEASGKVSLGRRSQVVRAALFFVLGFTLVYTAAGAVIGYISGRLGDSPDFEIWQRYFGIAAGIVIIILAIRVAAKVRAPLVCKMPVLSGMSRQRNKPANPLELMAAGIAFATGCMTCFGAAMVVAMVVYVGMSSSALFGATVLFLFSVGMAIPLVIAAAAMAKVLPLVFKLEKVVPWMGLASSVVMVGFAILLITGNYMEISEFFWKITGSRPGA